MKKVLFILLCTAFVFQSCSKDQEEKKEYESIVVFSKTYNSKDSIHHYAIDGKSLYKLKRGDFAPIWEKPCTQPSPIKVDLGYGEFKEIGYDYQFVVLDTDDNIFTLWFAKYRADNNIQDLNYKFSIGLYSPSGDFIKNKEIGLGNDYGRYKFVEMYNKNILSICYYDNDKHTYSVMDNKLNIIEHDIDKYLPFDDFVRFVNSERYISYSSSSIIVFDWVKKEIIGNTIDAFLAEKYPDEEHSPKFYLSDIKLKSNYVEAIIKATLYNGKTESINIRISYDSGEIIEQR